MMIIIMIIMVIAITLVTIIIIIIPRVGLPQKEFVLFADTGALPR